MARASRSKRSEKASLDSLMATVRSSRVSRALYTSPIPPAPMARGIDWNILRHVFAVLRRGRTLDLFFDARALILCRVTRRHLWSFTRMGRIVTAHAKPRIRRVTKAYISAPRERGSICSKRAPAIRLFAVPQCPRSRRFNIGQECREQTDGGQKRADLIDGADACGVCQFSQQCRANAGRAERQSKEQA